MWITFIRTSQGIWPACSPDRKTIALWSIGSRVRKPIGWRVANEVMANFWIQDFGGIKWWKSPGGGMSNLHSCSEHHVLKSMWAVTDHEKGQEKPQCEIGIEMCRDKFQDIFQPIRLNSMNRRWYIMYCAIFFSPTDEYLFVWEKLRTLRFGLFILHLFALTGCTGWLEHLQESC